MEIRKGIGVSVGYAIGEAFLVDREEYRILRRTIAEREVEGEVRRFFQACDAVVTSVRERIEAVPRRIREVVGSILETQVGLLRNKPLQEEIAGEIRKNMFTAEHAASRTLKRKMKALEDSSSDPDSAAFAQRVLSDIAELEKTLLRQLLGAHHEDGLHFTGKVVIVAHDLSPAQTIGLDRTKVLGFLTEAGAQTSHTAIIARSLGIPAVVGAQGVTNDISGGDRVILDGTSGTVIINPDEATLKRYEAHARNFVILEKKLSRELHDLPAVTKDGTRVELFANIESPDEIQAALDHGAEGIGLYRTEFLYMDRDFVPDEKTHLEAYRRAIQALGTRKIVIRTMDLGADKMPISGLPHEDNPFLGTRAIRLCFERPDIFATQVRAILRAAPGGNVAMMIPMISSLSEVTRVKEIIGALREDLRRASEPFAEELQFGIMVEVPSAAMTVDLLAPHVDFMSVGTNDLIAYTVAVDRKNDRVAPLYQPAHPAILRFLKQIIESGARHKKPVSVCGEMSSDVTYTLLLLGMGLRIFSVVTPVIPEIKKLIRSVTIEEAKSIAERALAYDDARATVEFLKTETRKYLPESG